MEYYDRDGSPLTQKEWGKKHVDVIYKIVSRTALSADVVVSTVWLGINHNWYDDGPPIIFETMVFGGPRDQEMERYATEAAAIAGHLAMVDELRREQAP